MGSDNAVVNSCRVCGTSNQDEDSECLYEDYDGAELTGAGRLYEELFYIQIDRQAASFYPRYLCNSCYLQMKLFKKLRIKASKTLEALRIKYTVKEDHSVKIDVNQELKTEPNLEIKIQLETPSQTNLNQGFEGKRESENHYEVDLGENSNEENFEVLDIIEALEPEDEVHQYEEGLSVVSDSCSFQMEEYKLQETTEINSEIEGSDLVEILDENFEQFTPSTPDDNKVFTDVHYVDDDYIIWMDDLLKETTNKPDKRNFCRKCQQQFCNRTDFLKHKKETHFVKYTCNVCSKVFQTADAHNVHYKLHLGQPAYKCELCDKSFNQKVHYNYHMAKHNNIRNFKCEICAKSFIAKGDLSIHMRTHTGERRYSCDICQKEFLLMVHMKNHRYSHFEKKFECKICQQKFVSPSTLRTHTQSIHENEPRFQCGYCVKKFRRKHHLIAHYKVHRKNTVLEEYHETGHQEIEETVVSVNVKNESINNQMEIHVNY